MAARGSEKQSGDRTKEACHELCSALQLSGRDLKRLIDTVVGAYTENHRKYHTLEHLDGKCATLLLSWPKEIVC